MKRILMFCCLGYGMTVCDTLHQEHGDFMTVAHIDTNRKIKYYKTLLPAYIEIIENMAKYSNPSVSVCQSQKVFNNEAII